MPKSDVIIVNVQSLKDWYVAKSDDINNFIVTCPDLGELIKDIPAAIKAIYKIRDGLDVEVTEGGKGDNSNPFPQRYVVQPRLAA